MYTNVDMYKQVINFYRPNVNINHIIKSCYSYVRRGNLGSGEKSWQILDTLQLTLTVEKTYPFSWLNEGDPKKHNWPELQKALQKLVEAVTDEIKKTKFYYLLETPKQAFILHDKIGTCLDGKNS